jgi:hypothetical protein
VQFSNCTDFSIEIKLISITNQGDIGIITMQQRQSFNQIIIALIFIKVLIVGYLGTQFFTSSTNSRFNATTNSISYPTSLPWIGTKSDCEYRGREWRNNKCWDSEHSMMF